MTFLSTSALRRNTNFTKQVPLQVFPSTPLTTTLTSSIRQDLTLTDTPMSKQFNTISRALQWKILFFKQHFLQTVFPAACRPWGVSQAHSTTLPPQGEAQLMSHHHHTGLSDHFDICQLSTSAHLKHKPPAPPADTNTLQNNSHRSTTF